MFASTNLLERTYCNLYFHLQGTTFHHLNLYLN